MPTSMKLGTQHVCSMGRGTKLLESRILNLGPCATWDHPEVNPVARDDQPPAGAYFNYFCQLIDDLRFKFLQPKIFSISVLSKNEFILE